MATVENKAFLFSRYDPPIVSGGGSRGHSGGVVRARPLNASGGDWRGWEPEVNGGPKFSL